MVLEFLGSGRKRSLQTKAAVANDPEAKKRKISELVDQMLTFEPNLTTRSLINMYEEIDASKVR